MRLGETGLQLTFTMQVATCFSISSVHFCAEGGGSSKHARECQHFTLDPALPVTSMILVVSSNIYSNIVISSILLLYPKLRCSVLSIKGRHFAFHGISWHFMAFHGCDLAKTRLLLLEYMMFHDCLYAPWSAISLSYLFASLEMYLLRASWVASTASSEFGKCEGTFLHVSSIKYASTENIIEVFEACPILFFIHLQCFHLQLERVVSDILSLHDQTYGNRCSAVSVHISKL